MKQDSPAHLCIGRARRACEGSVSAKDGAQVRRLLAPAAIYGGATRTEAAKLGDVGVQLTALRATSFGRFNAVAWPMDPLAGWSGRSPRRWSEVCLAGHALIDILGQGDGALPPTP